MKDKDFKNYIIDLILFYKDKDKIKCGVNNIFLTLENCNIQLCKLSYKLILFVNNKEFKIGFFSKSFHKLKKLFLKFNINDIYNLDYSLINCGDSNLSYDDGKTRYFVKCRSRFDFYVDIHNPDNINIRKKIIFCSINYFKLKSLYKKVKKFKEEEKNDKIIQTLPKLIKRDIKLKKIIKHA